MRMLMTFFKEFTTQSNTAFNFGTRFIVFKGLSTLNTLNDLIVDKLLAPALFLTPLKQKKKRVRDFCLIVFLNVAILQTLHKHKIK